MSSSRGYLGRCPVDLTPAPTWEQSYLEQRVRPLIDQAAAEHVIDPVAVELAARLGTEHLGPVEPPSLVHGDLWSGNRLVDSGGRSWLIDPAAHYAHRELDLAMMALFGGFSDEVITGYQQEYPLHAGWQQRIAVHQVLPLVVHALLFGAGYGPQTVRALRSALAQ